MLPAVGSFNRTGSIVLLALAAHWNPAVLFRHRTGKTKGTIIMKPSKKSWPIKECDLSVLESIERKWIVFVLARSNTLGEAVEYLDMDETTLFKRRKKYDIPAPPRNSYDGPKLTKQEMADAFLASLVATAQATQPVAPPLNITFVPPTNPNPLPPAPTSPPNNAG
jgi:hypothetical protein